MPTFIPGLPDAVDPPSPPPEPPLKPVPKPPVRRPSVDDFDKATYADFTGPKGPK